MESLNTMQTLAVWALPVLFAITLHEVAHGWVARLLGDPTAMMLGRLSLNPIKHIDPVGTVLVPALLLFMGGFVFGWAKPVPVTVENLRQPKRDMALVAIAGPLANLVMAVLWAVVFRIATLFEGAADWAAIPLLYMGVAGVTINALLMVLNLLPLPRLDGGRVLMGVLPGRQAYALSRLEPYGFLILVGLLATGLLGRIMGPPLHFVRTGVFSLVGV